MSLLLCTGYKGVVVPDGNGGKKIKIVPKQHVGVKGCDDPRTYHALVEILPPTGIPVCRRNILLKKCCLFISKPMM